MENAVKRTPMAPTDRDTAFPTVAWKTLRVSHSAHRPSLLSLSLSLFLQRKKEV
jgi:hypothetical protein